MESSDLPQQIHRYRILSELGRGSMGRVYLAEDPNLERRLALKILSPRRLVDPDQEEELRERFLVEARAAGRLHHPGIATVYDADKDPRSGVPYLAMEYVDGPSLHQRLRGGRPLPVAEALHLVAQVARALDYAHRQEVVHRDIKPANLLLHTAAGLPTVAKVVDFGIAKLVSAALTQPGYVVGTPNYMAPEQVRGQPVDGRADLFALGAVLYESLTGRTAFGSADLANVHYKILSVDPRPPEMHNPAVTPSVRALVDHALAKDPDLRFQSGQEMADALEATAQEMAKAEGGDVHPGQSSSKGTRRLSVTVSTATVSTATISTATPTPTTATELGSVRDPRLPVAVGRGKNSRWWYPVAAVAFALLAMLALVALLPQFTRYEQQRTAAETSASQLPPPWRTVPTPPFSTASLSTSPPLLFPTAPPHPVVEESDQIAEATPAELLAKAPSTSPPPPPPAPSPPPPPAPSPPPRARPKTATTPVEIVLRSDLRDSHLSAWIDGRKVLSERMTTGPLQRLWGKEFRFSVSMPTGRHTLELHLSGVSRQLEAQKKIRHEFVRGRPQVLRVRREGKELHLQLEAPAS